MNNVECESCVKRKTMYCPNSFKCYATKDKPYWQNRIMLLEENNQLKEKNSIYKSAIKGQMKKIEELKKGRRISKAIHKERNRKLKEEKQELKNKITLLNTMNENNYNNYCELLKQKKELRSWLEDKIKQSECDKTCINGMTFTSCNEQIYRSILDKLEGAEND